MDEVPPMTETAVQKPTLSTVLSAIGKFSVGGEDYYPTLLAYIRIKRAKAHANGWDDAIKRVRSDLNWLGKKLAAGGHGRIRMPEEKRRGLLYVIGCCIQLVQMRAKSREETKTVAAGLNKKTKEAIDEIVSAFWLSDLK